MQFSLAEDFVRGYLKSGLSSSYYYHDYHHTFDVLNSCVKLAEAEKISGNGELKLLKTAALYHDCGFVNTDAGHEEESCRLAKETLPGFGYSADDIETICRIIMKTKVPQKPETHLQKILCDADLDYLGRDDYEQIADKLFREWYEKGKISSEEEWHRWVAGL